METWHMSALTCTGQSSDLQSFCRDHVAKSERVPLLVDGQPVRANLQERSRLLFKGKTICRFERLCDQYDAVQTALIMKGRGESRGKRKQTSYKMGRKRERQKSLWPRGGSTHEQADRGPLQRA